MESYHLGHKKKYADTILAAGIALFLIWMLAAAAVGIDFSEYTEHLTKKELVRVAVCLILFAVFSVAAAFTELKYLGWQEIHFLPLASVFLGIAIVITGSSLGWFFIICGVLLIVYYIARYFAIKKYGEWTQEDEEEYSGKGRRPQYEYSSKAPVNFVKEEIKESAEEVSDKAKSSQSVKIPEQNVNQTLKSKPWREYIEGGLVLSDLFDGRDSYVLDIEDDLRYHYDKTLRQLVKCGIGDSPELSDIIQPSDKDRINRFVRSALSGETGAKAWSRRKNEYVPSLVSVESMEQYPGIRLITVTDVSESVEDLRDEKQELLNTVSDCQKQIRMLEGDEKRIFFSVIELMSSLVDAKSEESHSHVRSVCKFSEELLKSAQRLYPEMGIDDQFIINVSNAAILHDIGKILLPDSVLQKKGALTKEEFEIMKKHPVYGAEIINRMPYIRNEEETMRMAREIALHHHERADGGGYPDGISAEEMPFYVQVAALADVYDGLTAKRSYKEAYTQEEAYRMIMDGKCGSFTKKVLSCFEDAQAAFYEIRLLIQ